MISDGKEGIVSLGFREFCDEVQCYCLKWECFRSWVNWLEWGMYGVRIDFVSLTVCTSLDVFLNILSHTWPPIVVGDELDGTIDAWMAVYRWIMMCLDC